jgi:predicted  nucleic acid-binding Zn-ribbon protein
VKNVREYSMKMNLIFIVIIAALCSTSIFAQRGMSVEDRMKNLDKELDLSDKQYTQIEEVLEDQMKKFRKLRDESDGDWEGMREKARKMRKDTDDEICKVLNEDQTKKYRKLMEERRQKWQRERSRN